MLQQWEFSDDWTALKHQTKHRVLQLAFLSGIDVFTFPLTGMTGLWIPRIPACHKCCPSRWQEAVTRVGFVYRYSVNLRTSKFVFPTKHKLVFFTLVSIFFCLEPWTIFWVTAAISLQFINDIQGFWTLKKRKNGGYYKSGRPAAILSNISRFLLPAKSIVNRASFII